MSQPDGYGTSSVGEVSAIALENPMLPVETEDTPKSVTMEMDTTPSAAAMVSVNEDPVSEEDHNRQLRSHRKRQQQVFN